MTLYRKYRPQQFKDLLGQEAVSTTLQQAIIRQRLGHAYLFSGPRGTGKTSAARIFARAAVCQDPKVKTTTVDACGKCESCTLLSQNQTTDLLEIDAASNRGVEDIRELRSQTGYRPMQLSKKIYIIDEVHMLTVEAFNALLKTLEEPPEYCLFILATTELYKVPLTIRSRCQLLRFDRGSTAALEKALKIAAAGEGLEVDDTVYTLIAEHAEGGFRDALSLLESLSTRHTHLTRALAEEGLGILPELQARELLEACLTGDTAQLLPLLAQQKGQLPGSLDAILSQLIRQVQERLYHSKIKNTEHLAYALQQFLEAYILLRSTPVASLPLELACLSICQYVAPPGHTDIHRPSQLNKSPEVHGIALDVTVSPTPPKEREPVVELRQDAVKDPRQAWKLMIEQICRENLVLGQTLKQTVFHKAEGQTITIHVRYQFHADKLNEKRNRNYVLQLLHDLTGRDWSVEYEVSTSVPKPKVRKEITVGEADAVAVFGN